MPFGIILKRAFRDIKQNIVTHSMTTLVVVLTCLIFVFFNLFSINLQRIADHFGKELTIIVYLKKEVPQEKVPSLYQQIVSINGIKNIKFISSEDAFKRLERYFSNEKEILEGVDPTFLPPAFEIQIDKALYNTKRVKKIAKEISEWNEVAKVQYGKEWVDRLESFSKMVRTALIFCAALLLVTAAFVVSNTIKLTVYARQDEIEIMRLVGATNGFIMGPYLVASLLQGLLGSCTSLVLAFLAYSYLMKVFGNNSFWESLHLQFLPIQNIIAIVVVSGLFCMLGTAMALRRFLKL